MLFESIVFIGWAVPFFIAIEALAPRERAETRWGAIVLAGGMLVVNSILARGIGFGAPASTTTARIVIAWFAVELSGYWLHRAMHRIPLLWRVHKMHHANVPLAWHQSWWIHPLDIAMFAVVAGTATWLAGAPMTAAPWFLVVRKAWGILQHANVQWAATPLDHVIVTPVVHHRHHREDLPAANFAGSFSILDHVFGTFRR